MLEQDDIIRIAEATAEAVYKKAHEDMPEAKRVAAERHYAEHEYLRLWLEAQRIRKQRFDRIADTVVGAVVITGLLGFLAWVGHAALQYLRGG